MTQVGSKGILDFNLNIQNISTNTTFERHKY